MLQVAKEERIGFINPLRYVLDRLSIKHPPERKAFKLLEFRQVLLQAVRIQEFSSQSIVSAVKRDAMVIHTSSYIDLACEYPVFVALI